MKAYLVYLIDVNDFETTTKILGVYTSEEKAIKRVYDFEINEVDDKFESDECEYDVLNHNNGFLEAHTDDYIHKLMIDTKSVEMDEASSFCLFSVI